MRDLSVAVREIFTDRKELFGTGTGPEPQALVRPRTIAIHPISSRQRMGLIAPTCTIITVVWYVDTCPIAPCCEPTGPV